jgi:hypothetical protein
MTAKINLDDKLILKSSKLAKNGGTFDLVHLTINDIAHILRLQDKVFSALSADEKSFMLKKDRCFFEKHFKSGNTVLGVIHNGQLIAQSIIVNPTADNPKTGMVDMVLPCAPENLTVIQGVVVDPDFRGNALMMHMVDVWLDISNTAGRSHAISEVTVNNPHSWVTFMKEGLRIHSIGIDKSDNTEVYNMCAKVKPLIKKRLNSSFNSAAKKKGTPCAATDIKKQKKLLQNGFQGVTYDPVKHNIYFRKPKAGRAP